MRERLPVSVALLTLPLVVAPACGDSSGTEPHTIAITAPTALHVGEAATISVTPPGVRGIRWEVRRAAPWSAPELSGTVADGILDVDQATSRITGLAVGRVWLVASIGAATDSALISVERPESIPLTIHLGVNDVSPGFNTLVVTTRGGSWTPLEPYREGRWLSSNPAVASWSAAPSAAFSDVVRLTAHAPGETLLRVEYGGQSDTFRLRVRDPGPLAMDEAGRCGLNVDGELWCRGINSAGELATLTATSCYRNCSQQPSDAAVHGAPDHRFRAISSDLRSWSSHTCAIGASDSRAYCWGFNRTLRDTTHRLAGPSGSSFCPESDITDFYALQRCSFEPLAVDRAIPETLIFRTIKVIDHRTCGTTGGPGEPEEIWCWGDTSVPTRRTAFPDFATVR